MSNSGVDTSGYIAAAVPVASPSEDKESAASGDASGYIAAVALVAPPSEDKPIAASSTDVPPSVPASESSDRANVAVPSESEGDRVCTDALTTEQTEMSTMQQTKTEADVNTGMRISVIADLSAGESLSLTVKAQDTVAQLKDLIQEQLGISTSTQSLVFKKSQLEDATTLEACGIKEGASIIVLKKISALGCETVYKLPDENFTCSSQYKGGPPPQYAPFTAKLDYKCRGWAPAASDMRDMTSWLQIDLGDTKTVTGVSTQGSGHHEEWTTFYAILIGDDEESMEAVRTADGSDIFKGNVDRNTIVKHVFQAPVQGRYVRFKPTAWASHVTLRVEIFVV